MKILSTPDERFEGLQDYPFEPRYTEIDEASGARLRVAALDEGPRDKPPVLLMHGEPTWSYLYRTIAKRLIEKGHRVVAPDLVGFGRSDKPAERAVYTYEAHVRWMSAWLTANELDGITLFAQDWGGLIGLRLVTAFPERFARVVVANTFLPAGFGATDAFRQWRTFSQEVPNFACGKLVASMTLRTMSDAEKAAYDAPFPDESYKAGARQFPLLVPVEPDMPSVKENIEAWKVLEQFDKPFLTAFSDSDPITRGGDKYFQERVPGAKDQPHVTIAQAGHFLQEEKPDEIADVIDRFIAST